MKVEYISLGKMAKFKPNTEFFDVINLDKSNITIIEPKCKCLLGEAAVKIQILNKKQDITLIITIYLILSNKKSVKSLSLRFFLIIYIFIKNRIGQPGGGCPCKF